VNAFFFMQRELLGAIRVRSAVLLSLALLCLFLFLGCFASLFLLSDASSASAGSLGATDLVAYVSPRLSDASRQNLFLRIQDRTDVQSVRYSLPEQITSEKTGGSFVIVARSAGVVGDLAAALKATDGIVSVETSASAEDRAHERTTRLPVRACHLFRFALVGARRVQSSSLRVSARDPPDAPVNGLGMADLGVEVTGLLIGLLAGVLLAVGLSCTACQSQRRSESRLNVTAGRSASCRSYWGS
jgi:hypothetical protein